MEKVFLEDGNQKKVGVAIFISDKTDFKIKTVIRDKKENHRIINRSTQEKKRTTVNICTQIRSTSIYMANQAPIKEEIDSETATVGDINIPLSSIDRSSKQKNQ